MPNDEEYPDPYYLFGVWAEQNGYNLEDSGQLWDAINSYALNASQLQLTFEENANV